MARHGVNDIAAEAAGDRERGEEETGARTIEGLRSAF